MATVPRPVSLWLMMVLALSWWVTLEGHVLCLEPPSISSHTGALDYAGLVDVVVVVKSSGFTL